MRVAAPRSPSSAPRRARGFTLIELLSTVAIFALLAAIAIPNLGIRTSRRLDDETKRLASTLEFARQRAVMTGIPHRIVFDLDGSAYWLEWYVSEAEHYGDTGEEEAGAAPAGPSLDLAPPEEVLREFRPVLGTFGDVNALDEGVFLASVETPDGVFEGGESLVVFERDGTSDPAVVAIETEDGDAMFLELAPLADTVRFGRDES